MTAAHPEFGREEARSMAAECFVERSRRPGAAAGERIGLELEWLTISARHPDDRLDLAELEQAAADGGDLPHGGQISFEPGGQLELDTAPHLGLDRVCAAAAADARELSGRLGRRGVALVPVGLDAMRTPRRVLRNGRYDAMEAAFDAAGPHGRRMMCNTAALQVNLDLGPDPTKRWALAHALGPVLVACFANSPFGEEKGVGRPSGWVANRLATWWSIDPTRTAPPGPHHDPTESWLDYALDANVLLIRQGPVSRAIRRPMPFRRWMAEGHELGWPTADDFAYHLTTLFPPVRPRRWLEFRMLDALDDDTWPVAVAMLVALVTDPGAAEEAIEVTRPTAALWQEAARHGLAHPVLAEAATRCVRLTLDALDRLEAPRSLRDLTASHADRYVHRRRCPADDRLDEWHRHGRLLPGGCATTPEAVWA